jgi:hypothetical protein
MEVTHRSMTLLNEMGDLSITWEEDKDEKMAEIIQKKMDMGVRFFIIQPFTKQQIRVQKLSDVVGRTVSIPDEDVEKLFTNGEVGIVKRLVSTVIDTIRPATNAIEVVKNHTIGVKQMSGG